MFLKKRRPECREYVGSTPAAELLGSNGLDGFDALWSLEAPWVERPNYRRRGWSGVCRLELQVAPGSETGVYLKRQQGHCYRSARPPFALRPTAYREYRHLARMARLAIGAGGALLRGTADRRYLAECRMAGLGPILARFIHRRANRKCARHGGCSPLQPGPLHAGRPVA